MGGLPLTKPHTVRRRIRRTGRAGLAVAVLAATASIPEVTGATPDQEEPSLEEQQTEVRERQGQVTLEIDVLEAQNAEVAAALAQIDANVASQQAAVTEATAAKNAADTALVEAENAVAEAEARVAALNEASDALVVESYVAPPAHNVWDTLSAETISDATLMQMVLDLQADEDANVLELLEQAHEDLGAQRDQKETAAANAEAARVAEEGKLAELEGAQAQQTAFLAEIESTLDHRLTEAANLETIDAELSRQIVEEQAERARQAEAARQAAEAEGAGTPPPSGTITPGPDGLATVSCHNGGSITVADTLAPSLQALLDAAAADGLALCGGGWRDPQQQIELRKAHCGTSYYAIYQMPASQCSPPTARPGTSQHEVGLAVDFVNCSTRSTACYQWLAGNASDYGLFNLPSEPWHWSTTGN
jgi:LAS superfamily LD-carboxypeptidase LdcB